MHTIHLAPALVFSQFVAFAMARSVLVPPRLSTLEKSSVSQQLVPKTNDCTAPHSFIASANARAMPAHSDNLLAIEPEQSRTTDTDTPSACSLVFHRAKHCPSVRNRYASPSRGPFIRPSVRSI